MTDAELTKPVRTMQIIAAMLSFGLCMFGGMVAFLVANAPATESDRMPIITWMGLGMVAVLGTLSFAVPILFGPGIIQKSVLEAKAAGKPAEEGLLGAYQTMLIIGLAMCEGAGFVCLIGYLIEKQPLALGGAAVAMVLMLLRFPTLAGVREWLARAGR